MYDVRHSLDTISSVMLEIPVVTVLARDPLPEQRVKPPHTTRATRIFTLEAYSAGIKGHRNVFASVIVSPLSLSVLGTSLFPPVSLIRSSVGLCVFLGLVCDRLRIFGLIIVPWEGVVYFWFVWRRC